MRLLVTADLHYDHARSRALAEQIIDEMNAAGTDVLLVVGDTATSGGEAIEQCLSRFRFAGPKLFVPGNHELWSRDADTYRLYHEHLPRRVRALGWHWLDAEPFRAGAVAIVGSVGWYDYAFASGRLGIPRTFYEHKMSPGAVAYLNRPEHLLPELENVPAEAKQIVARWNDGKFVRLGRSDVAFLDEVVGRLETIWRPAPGPSTSWRRCITCRSVNCCRRRETPNWSSRGRIWAHPDWGIRS